MSLPAASVPVAVLVLAWDETTPAVRALVEAAEITEPARDSLLVLVPAGPASTAFTQAEALPLIDSSLTELPAALSAMPTELAAAATPLAAQEAATAWEAKTSAAPATLLPIAGEEAAAPATALLTPSAEGNFLPPTGAAPKSGLIGLNAPAATAPGGPAVRVLRLSEHSLSALAAYAQQALPAPTWLGPASTPAAPYLGGAPATHGLAAPLPVSYSAVLPAVVSPAPATAPPLAISELVTGPSDALADAPATPSHSAAELPADSATMPAIVPPAAALTDSDASTALSEASELTTTPLLVDATLVQAGWPEALALLREPASLAEKPMAATSEQAADFSAVPATATAPATAAPVVELVPAALLPTASQFDAPNLNFQVIQYARFAVPVALAAQPFAVIYAPAWPTWLAAQELRHRTGRPLVLHVATLAAGDEPLDLAAGWPAEIQRQALHRADLILTETLALAQRLRRELNLPAHRVCPVPAAEAAAVAQALRTAQWWPAGA